MLSQIKTYAQNVVATFTPNHGNGSTNSEVANSGIPSLFLKPNDSQAMLPDCAFESDVEAYLAKLRTLLTSPRDRMNHLKDFTEAKVIIHRLTPACQFFVIVEVHVASIHA